MIIGYGNIENNIERLKSSLNAISVLISSDPWLQLTLFYLKQISSLLISYLLIGKKAQVPYKAVQ